MKKVILYTISCLFTSVSLATDTYTITEYQLLPNLSGTESMLIIEQGGGGYTSLSDNSSLMIEGTSILEQGVGGVWEIDLLNDSHLDISGGQVHEIDIGNDATATLAGGLIEAIYSYQAVGNPHITLYYSGDLPTVQEVGGFDYLVGNWGDSTDFNIYLHDTGYDTYGNFEFILVPEPATLALLGLGTLFLRKRTS